MDLIYYLIFQALNKKQINTILSQLPKGISYKGAVNYVKDLPNDPEIGDAYTVKYQGNSGTDVDGGEYVWGPYEGNNTWVALGPDLQAYQEKLVSGINIKTINGDSVLGVGDIVTPTYTPFKSTWRHDTIAHLLADINADTDAVVGKSYLGEVTTVTAAEGLFNGNAEIFVNIMNGTTPYKVIWCTVSSSNVDPYHWEATFINGSISNKGWTGFANTDTVQANPSPEGTIPLTGLQIGDTKYKVAAEIAVDSETSSTSENPVQNKVITNALNDKQDILVSGTNIKTINNESILGNGNITISGGSSASNTAYEEMYSIITNVTNGSYTGDKMIGTYSVSFITIVPDEGYELPSSITITNASYEYDNTLGLIKILNPTGTVNIVVVCIAVSL